MTTSASTELLWRGVHALRRSALWWAVGMLAYALVNLVVWPSLEGSDALESLEGMSETMLRAFGAQNVATPEGYLDGQVFALFLPLLFSSMAIASVTALTAGDEHAGRLELVHALPVTRRAVWLSRFAAVAAQLVAVAGLVALAVAALLGPFSFEGVGVDRVVAVTFACAALAGFHAAVAYAVGGAGASRAIAVAGAVSVLVAGYVANFLLPLSESLAGGRRVSPWFWALGDQPVTNGLDLGRMALLVALTAALTGAGTLAVVRRDIRSA